MEGHGLPWWEPRFQGICYMHGMCFDMLTPMLYIFVCRKIYGVIRGLPHGDERQLHLKVRVRCGQEELMVDILVDTGAQVSLVRRGLFK